MEEDPRRNPAPKPDMTTLDGRILWLLVNLYENNQRRMAADLDLSQAAISRVVRGEQKAGRRLTAAIAAHPKINPTWLYAGEGEPLLPKDRRSPPGGRGLPVAATLLPGAPDEHLGLFTGMHFPIADFFHRESRYWWQIPADHPVTRHDASKVKPGDLLLLETEGRDWLDADDLVLSGKLCVLHRGTKKLKHREPDPRNRCQLVLVQASRDGQDLEYTTFADGLSEPSGSRVRNRLDVRQIIAICVLLVRP